MVRASGRPWWPQTDTLALPCQDLLVREVISGVADESNGKQITSMAVEAVSTSSQFKALTGRSSTHVTYYMYTTLHARMTANVGVGCPSASTVC